MSAMQLGWLTSHYEQGKITSEEYAALYQRITTGETVQQPGEQKVARLHPETRRTLARVRSFKKLALMVNYGLALCLISIVYLSIEHYQVSGSLPEMSAAGLERLLTQAPLKPLPSDLEMAAEFLSQQSNWDERYISQIQDRWQNTLISERERISSEQWFHVFQLALSLQIIEQGKLARRGNTNAIQQAIRLSTLAAQLEESHS